MRTTIRLDDQLFAELKKTAADEGRPLAAVIEDALRESLARRNAHPARIPVRLPTFRGDGVLPGVDLDDTSLLLDLMSEDVQRRPEEGPS
ncbi:MAG: ribbon-helix-helix protein, CopG family [Thermoleophilia bacterium]|nr:ribbon-helix-helix protein, CopG family [Thermoleophilia bacterium]